MKIRKGDTVKLMVGKDVGKTGKVLRVDPKNTTVLVEGLNMFRRHTRPKKQGEKGQVISLPGALNISKIMLVCPSCKAAVRVGFRVDGDKKNRICKNCNSNI